ncbi:hypothetical protein QPK13_22430 [Photorhabdus tasmaniensis]
MTVKKQFFLFGAVFRSAMIDSTFRLKGIMDMAFLVKADRTTKEVFAEDFPASKGMEGEFDVQDLTNFVGGYLEMVTLRPPLNINGKEYCYMLCDEDGKRKEYPVNYIACEYLVGSRLVGSDFVVGDVVFLERHEIS